MKDKKKVKNNKIIFVVIAVVAIIFVCTIAFTVGKVIRTSKINKQAFNNVNTEEKLTTIFCDGNNISLSNDLYNMLKDEGLDLVIVNDVYKVRIANEDITQKLSLDIKVEKDKSYDESMLVNLFSNSVKEMQVAVEAYIPNREYVSEYTKTEGLNVVKNNIKVDENGFADIKIVDDANAYVLAYVIPNEIEVEDIEMYKGEEKEISLKLEDKDYTIGSVTVTCEDGRVQIINNSTIKCEDPSEYTLVYSSANVTKEAKLKVNKCVEKIESNKRTIELVKNKETKIDTIVTPDDSVNNELVFESTDSNIATVDQNGNVKAVNVGNCEIVVKTKEGPAVELRIPIEVKEEPRVTEIYGGQVEGVTYINGILLVNKTHPIPADYGNGLVPEAYNAFLELSNGAAQAGYDIQLLSGYRSYETQRRLYNNYVATYGQAEADTFSARPGTSEHQTGLGMDVGWIDDAYGDTPSGRWLAANCHKYGFIIRYQKGKEAITGYKYEPWHIRYLGVETATKVYNSGLSLEEYLGAI